MLIRRVRKNYENEVLSFSMPIYYFVARRPDYHLVCRVAVVVVVTNKPAKISTYWWETFNAKFDEYFFVIIIIITFF